MPTSDARSPVPGPDAHRVFGPLISTGDLEAHERLFCDVFGMEVAGRDTLDGGRAAALFGVAADRVDLVALQTPATVSGVVLCRFDPVCEETVRSYATRVDRDALKVVDFYAPDYEAALQHARGLGYEVVEAEAVYDLPEGRFREAHLWGPDNVVTAFLGGPAGFFRDFAQVTDRRVSEVQSISAPLSDAEPAVRFYAEVFGWEVVYEYAIHDPSFADLLGVDAPLRLRSRNVGPSTREPYFGLIDYGLPADVGGSLLGRPAPPRRGLLGAVVLADDLDAVRARAGEAVVGATSLGLSPFAGARAVLMHPPHQIPHLVVEVAAQGAVPEQAGSRPGAGG